MKNLTLTTIQNALDWSYDKAINGMANLDSAIDLSISYGGRSGDKQKNIEDLIAWQTTKAATSGFVTGLGGVLTLPVAVPANVASVLWVQIRMVAAIAHMHGHDIRNDKVKTVVFSCLVGQGASNLIKEAAVNIGTKVATNVIKKHVTGAVLTKINKAVGFRLLTKFGTKGAINLTKFVPVVGGIIGGTVDAVTTKSIGKVANKMFSGIEQNPLLDPNLEVVEVD